MNKPIINSTFETSTPDVELFEEECKHAMNSETCIDCKEEETHKRLNDINTFMAYENELCLRGTDEQGEDLTIWFDSYDFLNWVNKSGLEYIKEKLTKYIKEI